MDRLSSLILCFVVVCLGGALWAEGDAVLPDASVSCYAVRMGSGEVLVDQDGGKSLVPASVLKVVTTAAALEMLGAEGRFETDLEYDGVIRGRRLCGNVYIKGGGDPCLGSDRVRGSRTWQEQLAVWVKAIEELGVNEIEGAVYGDGSRWESALAVASWSWEDLGNYYGAGASALSFHDNSYHLFFKPASEVGKGATIVRVEPPIEHIQFRNEVVTGPPLSGDQAWIFGAEYSFIRYLRGSIPAAVDEFMIRGAIPDPAALTAELLTSALRERGIAVHEKRQAKEGVRKVIEKSYSPTIGEIVHVTNRKSFNLYAEHLLKKMGERVYGEGMTGTGVKAVTEFWRARGLDLNGFYLADGSGLSRKNLITAKQLVSILLEMHQSKEYALFFDSLPEPRKGIRAKSGSMHQTRCSVGYAGDIAFAILINNASDSKKMREKIDLFFSDLVQKGGAL